MVENLLSNNEQLTAEIKARLARIPPSQIREHVRAEGMEVSYDREADHLYITIGSPRESLSISAGGELDPVVLYDPDTFEVRGFEVLFFKEKVGKSRPRQEFWLLIADFIERHQDTVYIPAASESERTEKAIGELAFA
jgi:hypothetical protein